MSNDYDAGPGQPYGLTGRIKGRVDTPFPPEPEQEPEPVEPQAEEAVEQVSPEVPAEGDTTDEVDQ